MILPVHARVRAQLQRALTQTFGLAEADVPAIVIETPPRRALGDLALPVAFELARRLRKAPKAIAQELAATLGPIDGVARAEAAPNGYLNLFLERQASTAGWLGQTHATPPAGGDKVIVEHTAINPNKAAHIGHLRNATLGDTLVRLLRFQGRRVEVQNYIDDTGVQVADVVVGFTSLENRNLESVRTLADDASVRFDYYCWDLYAKVTEWYEEDKTRLTVRAHALHAIEEGGNDLAAMGALVADRIVRSHLETMSRMGVDYDLLTWEGDILRLHFWAQAFEQLKSRDAVFLQTEGRLKGCWVMPIEDAGTDEGRTIERARPPVEPGGVQGTPPVEPGGVQGTPPVEEEDAEQREKVIVRSNGTVTYVGKDIANQFWKFGLLGKDFNYRIFEHRDGRAIWATTSLDGERTNVPAFGQASAVYNVIDSRQAYLQQLLKQALATMGFEREARQSTHFSYEMVALSQTLHARLAMKTDPPRASHSSRCPGARGWALKQTTCSTG